MNSAVPVNRSVSAQQIPAFVTDNALAQQPIADNVPTFWLAPAQLREAMKLLKPEYPLLHDLFAIDERMRQKREGQPASDFTVVYHLMSFRLNADIRIKVPLIGDTPACPSIVDFWPVANWYEREAWDMYGVVFDGHPNLRRILLPPTWSGHALRKEHPARATEMDPYSIDQDKLCLLYTSDAADE